MTTPNDLTPFINALTYAAEKHRTQKRKDADRTPYINHPLAVMGTLWQAGMRDWALLTAALLHDTIEDTSATETDLRQRFGDDVTDLVLEVTDDKSLDKAERKQAQIDHAPHMSARAAQLKIADKACNLHDLITLPPEAWSHQRKVDYVNWSEAVVDQLRGRFPQLEAIYNEKLATARQALEKTIDR